MPKKQWDIQGNPDETETWTQFRKQLPKYKKRFKHYTVKSGVVPMALIVHNFSRIGTDIDNVVGILPDGIDKGQVAIVVLHVTAKHALPTLPPTSTLSAEKYKDYGCMVDFFFTKTDGIYKCKLNKEAIHQLKAFIQAKCKENKKTK